MKEKGFKIVYKTEDKKDKVFDLKVVFLDYKKPDLGGYKNSEQNKELYHAFSQTDQIKRNHVTKFHRDTQTVDVITKGVTPMREFGVQTARSDLFISSSQDRVMEPRKYFNSDLWLERRILAARFIQKMIRGYFARKRMKRIKELKKKIVAEKESLKIKAITEEEANFKKRINQRMLPKSLTDFKELYNELQKWKKDEMQIITEDKKLSAEERQIQFKELLNKEIEVLQAIDQMKASAIKNNKQDSIKDFLEGLGKPKRWLKSDGRKAEVITPNSRKAQELYDLYRELSRKPKGVEERLDILIKLKKIINGDDGDMSYEIKQLINREADMIHRKRPLYSLEGLQLRLSNMFLRYIGQPLVNPEIKKYKKELDRLMMSNKLA